MDITERVTIDYLILANHVEAVNGLLYINGGGWTEHFIRDLPNNAPFISNFGIGISVNVPWNETNKLHQISIKIENEDATMTLAQVQPHFNVGRPPHLPHGSEQHAVFGLMVNVIFPQEGGYRILAQLDEDGESRRWPFRVHKMNQHTIA